MENKEVRRYLIIVFLLILAYVSYLIIKPYLTVLLFSLIIAFIFFPLYKKLKIIIKNETIAAFLMTCISLLVILLPLIFVSNLVIQESISLYNTGTLDNVYAQASTFFGEDSKMNLYVAEGTVGAIVFITDKAKSFVLSLPSRFLDFIILIYSLFYFFLLGETLVKKLKKIVPSRTNNKVVNYLGEALQGIIYGFFVIAILEALITIVGFYLIGVTSPMLWGVLVAFLALIPFIGPTIIWIPLTIYYLLTENLIIGFGVLGVGIILSLIDTLVRAKIVGHRAKIHPVIVLIGVLGGIQVLGLIGLLIGPLILSVAMVFIQMYYNDHKRKK